MQNFFLSPPGKERQGPYDEADLRQLLARGVIGPDTPVAEEGSVAAKPLAQALDLGSAISASDTALAPAFPPRPVLIRSWAAVLLAVVVLAAAWIIVYRPFRNDPVALFQQLAERKKTELLEGEKGTYYYDIRRTRSEIIPYEADINCYHGGLGVQAFYEYRGGQWEMTSLAFFANDPSMKDEKKRRPVEAEVRKLLGAPTSYPQIDKSFLLDRFGR